VNPLNEDQAPVNWLPRALRQRVRDPATDPTKEVRAREAIRGRIPLQDPSERASPCTCSSIVRVQERICRRTGRPRVALRPREGGSGPLVPAHPPGRVVTRVPWRGSRDPRSRRTGPVGPDGPDQVIAARWLIESMIEWIESGGSSLPDGVVTGRSHQSHCGSRDLPVGCRATLAPT
jgi:hypothetical protein